MSTTPEKPSLNEYYERKYVMDLLLSNIKDREVSFIGESGVIRALKFRNYFEISRGLKLVGWNRQKQNMYRSSAKIREIPDFTFNSRERSKETSVWYRTIFDSLVYEYDLLFDFDKGKDDNASIADALQDLYTLKDVLDEYKVPYYVIFSGSKGFQLVIDGAYTGAFSIENECVQPHKRIVENIKKSLGLNCLDLRNNGVPNRLCKVPYSIVGENLAIPLTDQQLQLFNIEHMKKDIILSNLRVKGRGNFERFSDLTREQKIKNTASFIKMANIK